MRNWRLYRCVKLNYAGWFHLSNHKWHVSISQSIYFLHKINWWRMWGVFGASLFTSLTPGYNVNYCCMLLVYFFGYWCLFLLIKSMLLIVMISCRYTRYISWCYFIFQLAFIGHLYVLIYNTVILRERELCKLLRKKLFLWHSGI